MTETEKARLHRYLSDVLGEQLGKVYDAKHITTGDEDLDMTILWDNTVDAVVSLFDRYIQAQLGMFNPDYSEGISDKAELIAAAGELYGVDAPTIEDTVKLMYYINTNDCLQYPHDSVRLSKRTIRKMVQETIRDLYTGRAQRIIRAGVESQIQHEIDRNE
jgi:hypothetical protein